MTQILRYIIHANIQTLFESLCSTMKLINNVKKTLIKSILIAPNSGDGATCPLHIYQLIDDYSVA